MNIFSKPPSTEGAITMTTSNVYLSRMADMGAEYLLVGLGEDSDIKIRPFHGRWPRIMSMEEVDSYPHGEGIIFAVRAEDEPDRPWFFAADTYLNVIQVDC